VLPVPEGLPDGCGLWPELAGDADADALGELVPAVPEAAGDVAGTDGLDLVGPADGPAEDAALVLLLEERGRRICSISRSYRRSCARISARLYEVMCRLKARISFHRAASLAAVEPDGAAGNDRSSWIAMAAVTHLMQL
jgi:hypothetical protein